MNKYTKETARRIAVNKILKRCKGVYKKSVLPSFGEDVASYDLKQDMYIFMPSDKHHIIGRYKGICFELINDRLFCFSKTKDEGLIGAFVARINDFTLEGPTDPILYPKESFRGAHLFHMYNKINQLADLEKAV